MQYKYFICLHSRKPHWFQCGTDSQVQVCSRGGELDLPSRPDHYLPHSQWAKFDRWMGSPSANHLMSLWCKVILFCLHGFKSYCVGKCTIHKAPFRVFSGMNKSSLQSAHKIVVSCNIFLRFADAFSQLIGGVYKSLSADPGLYLWHTRSQVQGRLSVAWLKCLVGQMGRLCRLNWGHRPESPHHC